MAEMKLYSDGVCHKFEREKTKLRLYGGSWSINIDKIDISKVKGFVWETSTCMYLISLANAKKYGVYRTFKGERKLVIPIKHWKTKELK